MFKTALFDCAINEKCCSVDGILRKAFNASLVKCTLVHALIQVRNLSK